jgi:broad specificity phosphatase PhoE
MRTGGLTTETPRPGAILLVRHGEPALSRKVRLNADEYRAFWAKYEVGGILPGQVPPEELREFIDKAGTLVSSTRLRAIESATACAPSRDFERHDVFIEAPLPPPRLPSWIRFNPRVWGFLARFFWWFFNNHAGEESRKQAEARAGLAAEHLAGLAASGQTVVLVAHGFFNIVIGRALKARGWRLAESHGYRYWSARRYERD